MATEKKFPGTIKAIKEDRDRIYAELKRIAEKSPVQDCQRLAICIMQTMEIERDGKITTHLPSTHHQ